MGKEGPTYECPVERCGEKFDRGKFFEYAAHMMKAEKHEPPGHHWLVCPLRHRDYPEYICGAAFEDQKGLQVHMNEPHPGKK